MRQKVIQTCLKFQAPLTEEGLKPVLGLKRFSKENPY
jgi:hypothetical protein